MRYQDLSKLGIALSFFSVIALGLSAEAKSNKYSRQSTTTAEPKADGAGAAPAASGEKKAAGKVEGTKADENVPAGEKKVDLTDLENRYWTAKDTEFTVVQNRLYTKANRFSFTLNGGPLLSDQYTQSWNIGGAVNYYFSERHGIEVQGWKTMSTDSDVTAAFQSRYATQPDHNIPKGYLGLSYNWIPIYAKISLLEKKILYFDMYISPGVGLTFMEGVTFATPPAGAPNPPTQSAPTLALDIGQQVFLGEHFALRMDVRNHFYKENVYRADTTARDRTKSTYYGSIMIGVTFFQ